MKRTSSATPAEPAPCKHNEAHRAVVRTNFLSDSGRFSIDVQVWCATCGRPFQFLGLPLGLDLDGAAMSVDGQTACLAAMPVGTVPQPLDKNLLRGYRINTGKDH